MYDQAINGDRIAREKFAALARQHSIRTIIETGTYHGVTTQFLSSRAPQIHTIEINLRYQTIARELLKDLQNIRLHLGNSPQVLKGILPRITQPALFFLDAHWGGYCPLLDELSTMAQAGITRPIIAIHDFQVPGTDLGYDTYKGQPYNLQYVEGWLPTLYPSGYRTEYNDETAEGARRGILYITPAN